MSHLTPTAALSPRTVDELRRRADALLNRFELERAALAPARQHTSAPLAVPDDPRFDFHDLEITDSNDVRDLWTFWRCLIATHPPPPEPPALLRSRGEAVAAVRSLLAALDALPARGTSAAGSVTYPLPRIAADSLPPDLRDSCEAAWDVVGSASLVVHWLKSAIDPVLTEPVKVIEDPGTSRERVAKEYPPVLTVTAELAADAVEALDTAYHLCAERVRLVRNDVIAHGDGVYSDGEFHAACAHDAAMEYARRVREGVDLLVRISPGGTPGTWGQFAPASALRNNWGSVLSVLRSLPSKFDSLPSAGKLQPAVLREAVKTAAARAQQTAGAPRGPVSDGPRRTLRAEVEDRPAGHCNGHTRVAAAPPTGDRITVNASSDSDPSASRAGRALNERVENDPELRAAWDRVQTFVAAVQEAVNSPERREAEAEQRRAMQEWAAALAAGLERSRGELAARHLGRPEAIEDWEHLARVVEMPDELLRTGDYSIRDVYMHALAWADRQAAKAKIVADALRPDAKSPSGSVPADGMQQSGGKPPADDPFAALRDLARTGLKGQERAVIEALCDAGGTMPIADLAIQDGVGWDDPFQGFKDVQRRLKPKLQAKAKGWRLERRDNAAALVT